MEKKVLKIAENTEAVLHWGDCLDVLNCIPKETVSLVVTSPPYPGVESLWGEMYSTQQVESAHQFLSRVWDKCLDCLIPGGKLVINIANTGKNPYIPNTYYIYRWALERRGEVEPKGEIIWDKGSPHTKKTFYGSWLIPTDIAIEDNHEYILVFRKSGKRVRPDKWKDYKMNREYFFSYRSSVWKIIPESAKKINHIAPFPVKIPERLVYLYTFPEEIVLDPFMGSGTTGIACCRLKRGFIGIEKEEEYFKLSTIRIESEIQQLPLFTE